VKNISTYWDYLSEQKEYGEPTQRYLTLQIKMETAIKHHLVDELRSCLEMGADPDMEVTSYYTALQECVLAEFKEGIRILLDAGANVNEFGADNITALHLAVTKKDPEIVEFLLKNGGDVNIEDPRGETPIQCIAYNPYGMIVVNKILDILLSHGADIDEGNIWDWTAFGKAIQMGEKLDIAKELFKRGADVNVTDNHGCNCLHRLFNEADFPSIKENILERVEFLIDKGIDVNVFNRDGRTPLMELCLKNSLFNRRTPDGKNLGLELMRLLLKNGANPNVMIPGWKREEKSVPLKAMKNSKNGEGVLLLLENGADISGVFKTVDELISFFESTKIQMDRITDVIRRVRRRYGMKGMFSK
jgi:ankyrin repeat protein